jgi:hypothetical protein
MQQKKPWDDFIEWISNLFNAGGAGVPIWIWLAFLMVLIALAVAAYLFWRSRAMRNFPGN